MSEGFLAFVTIFYVLVIVLGVIGNSLIVVAFLKGPKLRRVSVNLIMVHMAVVNLIHVCISNPFALIKNYDRDLIEDKTVNQSLAISFWLCFTMSLYSLVAISVNRYLLIAHPTTTFRRFCTGRAVGLLLGLIWFFAIIIHLSLWLQLTFSDHLCQHISKHGVCEVHRHHVTSMELIMIYSLVLYIPPLVIVPVMHSLTLYTMRSSTRRVQRAMDGMLLQRYQKGAKNQSTSPSGSNLGGSTHPSGSVLGYGKSEPDVYATCHLASQSLRAIAIVITPPAGSSTTDINSSSSPPSKKARGFFCPCSDSIDVDEGGGQPGPLRPRLGRQRGELRLIRLMLLVYILLIVTWIPSLVMMTDVFDLKELHIHGLLRLNLLYPLFPSLVPYIYLCSNRNFQRTLRRSIKRKLSSKKYRPTEQK